MLVRMKSGGKVQCGFISNSGAFHCEDYWSTNFEPVTLKPGDKVRIKRGAVVCSTSGCLKKADGYSDLDITIGEIIEDMIFAEKILLDLDGRLFFHESAISEIIEPENQKRTITISEETYQSIKGQLNED